MGLFDGGDLASAIAAEDARVTTALAALGVAGLLWTPTPTVTSGTSVSAVSSPGQWTTSRAGNIATFAGQLSVTVGAAGQSVITVEGLPYANPDFVGYFSTTTTDATKAAFVPGSINATHVRIVATGVAAGVCQLLVVGQYHIG